MKKLRFAKRIIAVNILGTVGYLLQLFVWVLFASIVIIILVREGGVVLPAPIPTPTMAAQQMTLPAFAIGIVYLVAILVALMSIFVFVTLPYFIGKWSSWFLRRMALFAKLAATRKNMLLIKLGVASLPLIGFLLVEIVMNPMDMTFSVVYVTAVIAATFALLFFIAQFFVAKYLHVADKDIW